MKAEGCEFAFASAADVAEVTPKAWAEGLLNLGGPSSYSARRGHLYVIGKGGEICVLDVKQESRKRRDALGEAKEGAKESFEIDIAESGTRLVPEERLPEGFLATSVEASPISSPYEQRLAICGLVAPEGCSGTVSTALFLASVNPLQARRKAPKASTAKVERSEGNYSVRKIHDNFQGSEHLNVLKFLWHPKSANHLVALLENPLTHESFLHVYNVKDGEGEDLATPEQKFCLRASGHGLGYGMVKVKKEHRFVDFTFGTLSGWASQVAFLTTQSGDVFCLGPLRPFPSGSPQNGGSPSRQEGHDEGGELVTVPQLYGPLEACSRESDDEDGEAHLSAGGAAATSITCISAGSNCIVLLLSFRNGMIRCYVVMGDLRPEISEQNAYNDLLRMSASLNAVECADIQILLIDRIDGGENGRVVLDSIEPENFFLVQGKEVFRVSLCWLRSLSQWLMDLLDEEGGEVRDLDMPPPVVSKVYGGKGENITFGEMISNRIDPHIAFGVSKGRVCILQVQDLEVETSDSLRPSVSFDINSLECSTAEMDKWYDSLPLSDKEAELKWQKRAGSITMPLNEYLHDSITNLKEGYIERMHKTAKDLNERLKVLKDSGIEEIGRAKEIEKSLAQFNKGQKDSRDKIQETVEKQTMLMDKAKKVRELISISQVRLSAKEVSFSEELRDMEGACAQLEERIKKIKSQIQRGHTQALQKGSLTQYIRQLPKVRSILEEDAATVKRNIAKVFEIKKVLDSM
ncbi:hypothetical protein HOP50_04g32900 [Chloropicon primus]|uniref:Uncharacterized protein n=2 Tax=Chloropicon primus TaxID=1764295 RepID=A0A5B8MJI0_9CHLO|nr:hypothetical protein A3770_04p32860 [Chloropicon primus]UPQ99980.1 hypothetical protein HOP50_04g32900 [Chloropicon primus]|eukprot:QDZ20768.1 hypothetical protein A3770_04p32860 [Chloropicon primus]